MKIHLCTNVIKKVFLLIIPNTKSRYSIHMSDYQVTMYSDIFKVKWKMFRAFIS